MEEEVIVPTSNSVLLYIQFVADKLGRLAQIITARSQAPNTKSHVCVYKLEGKGFDTRNRVVLLASGPLHRDGDELARFLSKGA